MNYKIALQGLNFEKQNMEIILYNINARNVTKRILFPLKMIFKGCFMPTYNRIVYDIVN